MKPSFEKLLPSAGESFRCFNRNRLRQAVKWHRHPEIELTYIEEGAGSRLVGDHLGSYTNHDLVLLGSELPHTWASDEWRGKKYDLHSAVVIQFHPQFLGGEFFDAPELERVSRLIDEARRGLWFPVETAISIGRQMTAMTESTGTRRLIELLSVFDELSRCPNAVPLASNDYQSTTKFEAESRIRTVCDHIDRYLTDPDLNHAMLADLVHMNPSAFSRFFKQSTGRTVSAYVTELRIGLACRLLMGTDGTILEISQRAGFVNLSNFNRRFRQLRGTTPRDYRTRYRNITVTG